MAMDSHKPGPKVFMFPWLAHGHISPFLDLAKRLSVRNFNSYICSTPANLSSIRTRIPEKYSLNVHLVELHLPSSVELPPHYHTTNGLPLTLHSTLRKSLKSTKPYYSSLLSDLKPHLVIHDIILPWAGTIASRLGIPVVTFFTSGAAMFSYFCHLGMRPSVEFPFKSIRLSEFELSLAHSNMESAMDVDRDPDDEANHRGDGIILVNSSREMEGKYMDYLSDLIKRKIVPIGALVSEPELGGSDVGEQQCNNDKICDDVVLFEWLGEKDKLSTVFVSFGSEYFLKKEEIEEVAYGLELSNANFIWIIRFPKGEEMTVEEALPQGFLERVRKRGRILENWAPQPKILNHSSVGGFVSHCGWNSLKESIDYGIPIIAMPMHLDQPMNAKLVVELGIGVEVKRDGEGRLQREEISKMIKHVVGGKLGENLRRSIEGQREQIQSRSKLEITEVVKKLEELCAKHRNHLESDG